MNVSGKMVIFAKNALDERKKRMIPASVTFSVFIAISQWTVPM